MASRLFQPAIALRPTATSMPVLRRSFAMSSINRIKESSGDVKDYEIHKEDSISKAKAGKGHWKPELASDGEEAVRADRTPNEDISKLQERTKKHVEEKSKKGTSATDPM